MGFGTMTQSTFAILLGGALTPNPRLLAALSGARVIAADGGMRHAARKLYFVKKSANNQLFMHSPPKLC